MKQNVVQSEQVLLDRHTNFLFMCIVILVSAATSAIFIHGNLSLEEMIIQIMPKLTLVTGISFTIFMLCFLVDGSSTFIIIMVFLSIILAVLQAFSCGTVLGLFTKDRVFSFSVDIWYNAEQTTLLTGTAFMFFNIIVLLVYVSYLAPTFTHHIRASFYEVQIDEKGHFGTKLDSDYSFTHNPLLAKTVKADKEAPLFHKGIRSTMELEKDKGYSKK